MKFVTYLIENKDLLIASSNELLSLISYVGSLYRSYFLTKVTSELLFLFNEADFFVCGRGEEMTNAAELIPLLLLLISYLNLVVIF